MENKFKFYNTLTRNIDTVIPHEDGKIAMYTCGPTVYHYAHIGNLRSYIMEDVLEKGLSALVYTQLTDVEDEVNGLFTYDRAAVKPDANAVRSVNAALAAEFARVTNPAKK